MVCAGVVCFTEALGAEEKADKRKAQAKEVAQKFVKAVKAKDLDAVLGVVEAPFAGSMTREERAVVSDKDELKKTLRRHLDGARDADKVLKIRRAYTYEEFGKDKDGAPVVDFLGPVFEKLGLAKDDVVLVDQKGAVYCVRIRKGKAKLAALFK
jgi:hypothetical protein